MDTYNGKEYETVLGTNGKMYDLKEKLNYPENFKNEEIASIGNNLNTDKKEIEVLYKMVINLNLIIKQVKSFITKS